MAMKPFIETSRRFKVMLHGSVQRSKTTGLLRIVSGLQYRSLAESPK